MSPIENSRFLGTTLMSVVHSLLLQGLCHDPYKGSRRLPGRHRIQSWHSFPWRFPSNLVFSRLPFPTGSVWIIAYVDITSPCGTAVQYRVPQYRDFVFRRIFERKDEHNIKDVLFNVRELCRLDAS